MEVVPNFDETVFKFRIWYKRSRFYPMLIADYLIVNIQLSPSNKNNTDILKYIVNMFHAKTVQAYFIEIPRQLYCECVLHDDSQTDMASSEIQNADLEILVSTYTSEDYNNACRHEENVLFRKIHVCPYVNISFTSLPMKIVNDRLYVTEKFQEKLEFSPWEFELKGDYILICLPDYKSIYDNLHIQIGNSAKHVLLRSQVMVMICIYVSVLVFWIP